MQDRPPERMSDDRMSEDMPETCHKKCQKTCNYSIERFRIFDGEWRNHGLRHTATSPFGAGGELRLWARAVEQWRLIGAVCTGCFCDDCPRLLNAFRGGGLDKRYLPNRIGVLVLLLCICCSRTRGSSGPRGVGLNNAASMAVAFAFAMLKMLLSYGPVHNR